MICCKHGHTVIAEINLKGKQSILNGMFLYILNILAKTEHRHKSVGLCLGTAGEMSFVLQETRYQTNYIFDIMW